MPSRTFFGLPLAKQAKIITAAKQILLEKPLSEVTIADIVQRSEIPRGSFYQYFKDKNDVYFFIVSTYVDRFRQDILTELDAQQGDLFETMRITFQRATELFTTGEDSQIIKNIFLDMDFRDFHRLSPTPPHHLSSGWDNEVKARADLSKLKIDPDEFSLLLRLLLALLGHSMARFVEQQRSEPETADQPSLTHFSEIMDWLEYGVISTKKESRE